MKIPEKMRDLLKNHYPCVEQSIKEFEPWIAASERPDFFPEYTNHGISHIEAVFQTAEALISEQSWEVLTPSDAATMILAILLHDSAMHITPDSFVSLLNNSADEYCIDGLDKHNWTKLWDDFLAEASRFDGRKLNNLFGSTDPVHPPMLDPEQMNKRDRKIIGEFLRRHHHSLAHQISRFGVPGPQPDRLTQLNVPEDIADLAGLAARSHGMALRPCIDYLNEKYNNKCEHKGVHTVFIMALLRVADYLHIQAERAPNHVFKITTLRSPLSKGHYDLHNAIRDVRFTHPDPETIEVNAIPPNVDTFLRTRKLLDDIQFELDASWAVLGEIYGRMTSNKLNLLGLKYRRIRSNLDEFDKFSKTVDYIPCHAAFDSAGADMLKLLIKPLYGDNPTFGIRELIQNAIDAVRERWEYEKRHDIKITDLPDQEADVIVSLDEDENGELWFTVSDKGIGMTAETVRNYFLRAGASFRKSDAWKKEFTNNKGKSRVLRSGRFGIGVLASFLIGDTIEVTTRHMLADPDEAIQLSSNLDTDSVELLRTSGHVGTCIRIKIRKEISSRLSETVLDHDNIARKGTYNHIKQSWHYLMDWYYCKYPSLKLLIKGKHAPSRFELPIPNSKIPPEWRVFKTEEFNTVFWTYIATAPSISCNGLAIETKKISPSYYDIPSDYISGYRYGIDFSFIDGTYLCKPALLVFDADGRLPVSLDRTQLTDELPFIAELKTEIIKDYFAYVLVAGPSAHIYTKKGLDTLYEMKYGDHYRGRCLCNIDYSSAISIDRWFSAPDGFSLTYSQNVANLNKESCILISNMHITGITIVESLLFFLNCRTGLRAIPRLSFARFVFNAVKRSVSPAGIKGIWPSIRGARIILPLKEAKEMNRFGNLKKAVRSQMVLEDKNQKWALYNIGDCPEPSMDLIRIYKSFTHKDPYAKDDAGQSVAEWYFHHDATVTVREIKPSISQLWINIIREPVIPYDTKERRKKLSHAFEELAPYIEAHEELLRRQKKEKNKTKN